MLPPPLQVLAALHWKRQSIQYEAFCKSWNYTLNSSWFNFHLRKIVAWRHWCHQGSCCEQWWHLRCLWLDCQWQSQMVIQETQGLAFPLNNSVLLSLLSAPLFRAVNYLWGDWSETPISQAFPQHLRQGLSPTWYFLNQYFIKQCFYGISVSSIVINISLLSV